MSTHKIDIQTPPNWRKGQTLFNFFQWLHDEKKLPLGEMGDRCADIFHIENDKLDEYFKEYILGNLHIIG